jgi:hypothetical protein
MHAPHRHRVRAYFSCELVELSWIVYVILYTCMHITCDARRPGRINVIWWPAHTPVSMLYMHAHISNKKLPT